MNKMYIVETTPHGQTYVINRRDCKFSSIPMDADKAVKYAEQENEWARAYYGTDEVETCQCGRHNGDSV